MRTKLATSFRLSEEARRLINALSEHMGVSQADVIEFAVRETARKLGVPVPAPAPQGATLVSDDGGRE